MPLGSCCVVWFPQPAHSPRLLSRHCSCQGRLTLLLGPPGAGKSVLLRRLTGQLEASPTLELSGEVRFSFRLLPVSVLLIPVDCSLCVHHPLLVNTAQSKLTVDHLPTPRLQVRYNGRDPSTFDLERTAAFVDQVRLCAVL